MKKTSRKKAPKIKKPTKKAVKIKSTKKRVAPRAKLLLTKTTKSKSNKMSEFQQYVVLAAVINQERNSAPEFQSIPLPEATSTLFAPLRSHLAKYAFTASDIMKATDELLRSKEFKKAFPVSSIKQHILKITEKELKAMMAQLLEFAGPEAKKTTHIIEAKQIYETTLEKHALKTNQIEPHPLHVESILPGANYSTHQQMVINMKLKNNRYAGRHFQNLSGKQNRGRG